LTLKSDEIISLLDSYQRESKAIREEVLRLCWYMRGSISYDDAMLLGQQDKDIIGKIISDNFENTKKSGVAFI